MKLSFLLLLTCCVSLVQAQAELPAVDKTIRAAFFIPSASLKPYRLTITQADAYMKIYSNNANDAALQRVNDIRWQATDKAAAETWFTANTKLLGEDGEDITTQVHKPAGTGQWKVYGPSAQTQKMMKAMGVEQTQYNFTFTVDKYVAKIFVAGGGKQTVMDAWKLGWEGLVATLTASGKVKKIK